MCVKKVWIIALLALAVYGMYALFLDTQRIRGQEEIAVSDSPTGAYTVTAYRNDGGATTAYAVLCSVRDNQSGRRRNIYWQYRCEDAQIEWLDETTVRINGVVLDVRSDVYDFRRVRKEATK